jgi:uncharacterized protein YwgA
MDAAQEALSLVLSGVGVGPDISTKTRRKAVQKAVYLAQAAGVDLGYRYNWYVMGPYSPNLTKDYFALRDTLEEDPSFEPERRLSKAALKKLEPLTELVEVPDDARDLTQADWLELLASIHFLSNYQGRDAEGVRARLAKEKGHVAEYYEVAMAHLQEVGLM